MKTRDYRADFPIFSAHDQAGRPLVYLDSAASAQKPEVVLRSLNEFYSQSYANIHRGLYDLSEQATQAYDNGRERVRAFLNAVRADEIVFTRGTTESINFVAHSWGRSLLREGDEIIVTVAEHHANLLPWQTLAEERRLRLTFVELNEKRTAPSIDDLARKLSTQTKIVAFTALSNVLGTAMPVRQWSDMAHAVGAKVVVDAAQAVAHEQIDVQAWDADFVAFSGHKLYGPTGIGVLYGKQALLEQMPPMLRGGDMVQGVSRTSHVLAEVPQRFEAGTPHIAGAVGLAAAIEYVQSIGFAALAAHDEQLLEALAAGLRGIGAELIAAEAVHRGLIAFTLDGVHPHDLAQYLGINGIAIRAGFHCAQPLHEALGVEATNRVSLGIYNTLADVEALLETVERASKLLRI